MQALWPDADNCLTSSSRSRSSSSSGSPRKRSRSVTPHQHDICSPHSNGLRSRSPRSQSRSLQSRSQFPRSQGWSLRSQGRSLRSRSQSPRSQGRSLRSRSKSLRSRRRSQWPPGRSPRSRGRSPRLRIRSTRSQNRSLQPRDRSPDQSPRSRGRSPHSRGRSPQPRDRSLSRPPRLRGWSPQSQNRPLRSQARSLRSRSRPLQSRDRSRSRSPVLIKHRKSPSVKRLDLHTQQLSVAELDIPQKKTSKKLLHPSKGKSSILKKSSRAPDEPQASECSQPNKNSLSAHSSKISKGTSQSIRPQSRHSVSSNLPQDSTHDLLKSEHSSKSRKSASLSVKRDSSLSSSASCHLTLDKTVMASDLSPAHKDSSTLPLSKKELKSNVESNSSFFSTQNDKVVDGISSNLSQASSLATMYSKKVLGTSSKLKTSSTAKQSSKSLESNHQASRSFETFSHWQFQNNNMSSDFTHVSDCLELNMINQQSLPNCSMTDKSLTVDNTSISCRLSGTSVHSTLKTDKLSSSSSKSRKPSSVQRSDGHCSKSANTSDCLLLEKKSMPSNKPTKSLVKTSHQTFRSSENIGHMQQEKKRVLCDSNDANNCLPSNKTCQESLNDPVAWMQSLLSKSSTPSNLSVTTRQSSVNESLAIPHASKTMTKSFLKRRESSHQSQSHSRREHTTQKSTPAFQATDQSLLKKHRDHREWSVCSSPASNCSSLSKTSMSPNVSESTSLSAMIVGSMSQHSSESVKQSRLEKRSEKSHHSRSQIKKEDRIAKSGCTFPAPSHSIIEEGTRPPPSEIGRLCLKMSPNQEQPQLSQPLCSTSFERCLWRDRCSNVPILPVHIPSDPILLTSCSDNEQHEEECAAEPSETCFSMEDFL